jgi:hypothetical protein
MPRWEAALLPRRRPPRLLHRRHPCPPGCANLAPDRSNVLCPGRTVQEDVCLLHPLNLCVDVLKNRRRSLRVRGPGRIHASPEAFHGPADREGLFVTSSVRAKERAKKGKQQQ